MRCFPCLRFERRNSPAKGNTPRRVIFAVQQAAVAVRSRFELKKQEIKEGTVEEYENANHNGQSGENMRSGVNRWFVAAIVALVAAAGLAFGYGYRQQMMVNHLTAQESVANATISDMQGQVNALTTKLNEMSAAQQAAAAAAQAQASVAHSNGTGARAAAGKKGTAESKRLKELQARIEEQQKQLKDTQDQVAKNRSDLEGNLNSTRDELNGSIAKTHEELVALAKRGERSYFEFDLTKSKQFQRVGPLTLSLRKADTKHKSYNLEMIVDDNTLTKKNVNLYEPIWIHTENESQPVQVVVNRVEKNVVHGYVSAPKYKPSELAVSSAGGASLTPVAAHPQSPDQNPQTPNQPE
jgi:DNA repair exonuclease SbcCD ATPase subunit